MDFGHQDRPNCVFAKLFTNECVIETVLDYIRRHRDQTNDGPDGGEIIRRYNRGWRIIKRGGESRAVDLQKSVPMVLMADNRELTTR